MQNIVEKIRKIENLYHAKGCTTKQLKEAQKELGVIFPEEFVDYTKEFGAISFYATEWTGLNVEGYLNVVSATIQQRKENLNFPARCFVLENIAIEGLLTVVDEEGHVYSEQHDKKTLLCNSISEYLDICVERKDK